MAKYDFSTIDIEKLKKLPVAKIRQDYHLQTEPGNGCYGDPPGFPTYFTRNVYTSNGNDPRRGPTMVISFEGNDYVVETAEKWNLEKRDELLKSLWKPLPLDHARTRQWIRATYAHTRNCYWDEKGEVEPFQYGKPTFFIFPVPNYKLREFHDDERFSDEWRAKEKGAIESQNAELKFKASTLAIPENHLAVIRIRKFYPEYQPEQKLIDNPGKYAGCDWWQRFAERPTPQTCAPSIWFGKHRADGWCQFCGYVDGEIDAEAL